uniref:Trm112 family protein n=1 Tax=Candidatus Methanomethylicus mesodigestus TaxID=1867258 RepID=A0A7C3IY49_9CREN
MKRRLLDILACPMCKHHPIDLLVFEEGQEIEAGMLTCGSCGRWYPIIDGIPHMLPDELRGCEEDVGFLSKWKDRVPEAVLREGKPYSLKDF